MARQHSERTFWRRGDAKLTRELKAAPGEILAHYGKASSLNSDGAVSFPMSLHAKLETALHSLIAVVGPDGTELNDDDAEWLIRSFLSKAIKKKGVGKPIAPMDALAAIDEGAEEFYCKPLQRYRMVAWLSVQSLPFKTTRVLGRGLTSIGGSSRYKLPPSLDPRSISENGYRQHLEKTEYKRVAVASEGRSLTEGFANGQRSLHYLRGLWTLVATAGEWSKSWGKMRRKPTGAFHVGPFQTLHQESGEAIDTYWYEQNYGGDHPLFKTPKWPEIEIKRKRAMRSVERQPYRQELIALIIRYAMALDRTDYSASMLGLWGILEKMTNTVGGKYDETIRRSVWLFPERVLDMQLLSAVRTRRNLFVHSAQSTEDADQLVYLLKWYVDMHLFRLIYNPFKVASLDEYGEQCSVGTDMKALKKQKKLLDTAIGKLNARQKRENA